MSSVSLESGLGTVSFDGKVLELFGFGGPGSRRWLEALIEEVKEAR